MSAGYALAYRLHVTPWERAGQAAGAQSAALLSREEAGRTPPYGRALDLGCGTGAHSIELAQRGWQVTGIDAVGAAVRQARARAADLGAQVSFLEGDVTALPESGVGEGFEFLLDVGCFHGLKAAQRLAMGRGVTAVSGSGATLLMLAFTPGRRGPLPRGADREGVETAFPDWTVLSDDPADTSGMPGPLKGTAPRWFRLRRN